MAGRGLNKATAVEKLSGRIQQLPKSQPLRPTQMNLNIANKPHPSEPEELVGWSEDDGDGSLRSPSPPCFAPLHSPPPAAPIISSQEETAGVAAEASIESGEVGSRVGEEEDDDEGVWEVGDDENEKDEDEPVPMDHADDSEPHIPAASSCSQPSTASPSNAVDRAAQQLENLLTKDDVETRSKVDSKGKKPIPPVQLLQSSVKGMQPTVSFQVDAESVARLGTKPVTKPKIFLKVTGIISNAVNHAFRNAGFRITKGNNWNALWAGAMKGDEFHSINRMQKVNHFPGTWELGRKDKLYRNLGKFRRSHGAAFDIVPRHYVLPRDTDEWRAEYERLPHLVYILKPCCSSRGRGIRVLRKPSDVPREKDGSIKECLVQRYITNPHLIDGYKYDLRLYVVVTCFDPLRVYLYHEGLVRFATERYSSDEKTLRKRCMHLTNYSINSKKAGFEMNMDQEEDGVGSKWSITALRKWFDTQGLDFTPVWEQIREIVVKTMMAVEPNMNTSSKMHVPHRNICYEVFGFDIVLDANLRTWLLEVNTGPALQSPAALDKRIKFAMVRDMLHLVGFVPYDKAAFAAEEEERRRQRLTGLNAAGEREKTTVPKRDMRSLVALDLSTLPDEEHPETLQEMRSEWARLGGFECVMPSPQPELNDYYAPLFESQRYGNVLNFQYIKQTVSRQRVDGDGDGAPREGAAWSIPREASSGRGRTGSSGRPVAPAGIRRVSSTPGMGLSGSAAALAADDAGIGNSAPSTVPKTAKGRAPSGLAEATKAHKPPPSSEETVKARKLPPASGRLGRTVTARPISSRVGLGLGARASAPAAPAVRPVVKRLGQVRFGGPEERRV